MPDDATEESIAKAWDHASSEDPEATVAFFENLRAAHPDDPALTFELAGAYDWAGTEARAIPLYEAALSAGLAHDRDLRARIQYGSSLRNIGRTRDAVSTLQEAVARDPDNAAARCFLALALTDAGECQAAVAGLLDLCVDSVHTPDMDDYGRALRAYADRLR